MSLPRDHVGGGGDGGDLLLREDSAEVTLKWLWAGAMLLLVSMFLPAGHFDGGRGQGPGLEILGWQATWAAHEAMWRIPNSVEQVNQLVEPFGAPLAFLIALCGVGANWLSLSACVAGYMGRRRDDRGRMVGLGARLAVAAAILAVLTTPVWFILPGLTPMPGAWLWMATPFVLAAGLTHAARTIARFERESETPSP